MIYLQKNWRPLLALVYGVICLADFVLFPLTWQVFYHLTWVSLTAANGGLVHISFGAILGAAAWTRGQEKIQALKATTEPTLGPSDVNG